MKQKTRTIIYGIITLFAVGIPPALDYLRLYSRQEASFYYSQGFYMILYACMIATPIVIGILFPAKLLMQRSVPVKRSRIMNAGGLLLFILLIFLVYPSVYPYTDVVLFIVEFQVTSAALAMQICALVYDLFSKRVPVGEAAGELGI